MPAQTLPVAQSQALPVPQTNRCTIETPMFHFRSLGPASRSILQRSLPPQYLGPARQFNGAAALCALQKVFDRNDVRMFQASQIAAAAPQPKPECAPPQGRRGQQEYVAVEHERWPATIAGRQRNIQKVCGGGV